jgi:hypothetical protein
VLRKGPGSTIRGLPGFRPAIPFLYYPRPRRHPRLGLAFAPVSLPHRAGLASGGFLNP